MHGAIVQKIPNAFDFDSLVLDAMPMSLRCWSKNLEIIYCNNKTIELFGLDNKEKYLASYKDFSPKIQPCGRPSDELAREYLTKGFTDGHFQFGWMHQTVDGEQIPAEIILVRTVYDGEDILVSYTTDLRYLRSTMDEMRKAEERAKIMLDTIPLCANFWDSNFNNIDCNQEAVNLFQLKNKQEYLDRFFELSPEYQPCGTSSVEMALKNIAKAFNDGYCRFSWLHCKLDGEPVPSEITLVRVRHRDDNIVVGYTRDLRELKTSLARMREADERAQIMLDTIPLCANFWDNSFNIIDCNQEAANLFRLKNKQEYLDHFFELSPKNQPCGTLSTKLSLKNIAIAFSSGYCRFQWMHCMLDGEPIPAEITLVRVKRPEGFFVVGYTRDLREKKSSAPDLPNKE